MDSDRPGFPAPSEDVELDAEMLATLSHPLRLRMLGRLRIHGPATATQLARELGESSGATSYHLRQLQAAGLVEEDPERGTRRERWWRSVHRRSWVHVGGDDESRAVGGAYLRAIARAYSERILRYADSIETAEEDYGKEWADASTISDWKLELTAEQATELEGEIREVIERFDRSSRGVGARTVVAQFQLLPLRYPEL
ncbi:MAG TPA: helix-turn-helix domain-containing protein [Jatrophihabitans sp.]|nr:helix-turn-helix domain-containing protein [Jatrophihabitans sp.]